MIRGHSRYDRDAQGVKPDSGHGTQNTVHRTRDAGRRTRDTGHRMQPQETDVK